MKLAAIKELHDYLIPAAIEDFNANGNLPPTMFIAELKDSGKNQGTMMVPAEIIADIYSGDADKLNSFISDLLTDGSPLRQKVQTSGISVNLVVQVLEGTLSHVESPEPKRCIVCMITQPEGIFYVSHPIEEQPVPHCIQAEFPAFETIRLQKAELRSSLREGTTPVRPTLH